MAPDGAPLHEERHRPEQTTLYCLVQQHAAGFIAHTEVNIGGELPRLIKDVFDAFPEGGILALGSLACASANAAAKSCRPSASTAGQPIRGARRVRG